MDSGDPVTQPSDGTVLPPADDPSSLPPVDAPLPPLPDTESPTVPPASEPPPVEVPPVESPPLVPPTGDTAVPPPDASPPLQPPAFPGGQLTPPLLSATLPVIHSPLLGASEGTADRMHLAREGRDAHVGHQIRPVPIEDLLRSGLGNKHAGGGSASGVGGGATFSPDGFGARSLAAVLLLGLMGVGLTLSTRGVVPSPIVLLGRLERPG